MIDFGSGARDFQVVLHLSYIKERGIDKLSIAPFLFVILAQAQVIYLCD